MFDSETLAYLYDNLVQIAPFACLWVASVKHSFVSHYLQEVQLTVPLRCPPAVVREIRQSKEIQVTKEVYDYVTTRIIYPTDGPAVRWIFHQNGLFGHTHQWPRDCVKCGHEIGCILTELCINKPESMSEGDKISYSNLSQFFQSGEVYNHQLFLHYKLLYSLAKILTLN